MPKYEFTAEQIAEIDNACKTITDKYTVLRLEAIQRYAHGVSNKENAEKTGLTESTLQRYVRKYRKDGLEALINRLAATNFHCQEFTLEQIAELRDTSAMVKEKHVARRLQAILLRAEGHTIKEVTDITGYASASITNLTKIYQKYGITAVMKKPKRPFAAYKHQFTAEQKAEIAMARETVTDTKVAARLEVLWLRTEQKNLPDIAELTGFHVTYITKLIKRYQEHGLDAFLKNGYKIMTYEEEVIILDDFCSKMSKSHPIKFYEVRTAFETELGRSVSESWTKQMLIRHHWHYNYATRGWLPPQEKFFSTSKLMLYHNT